jgi:hypothetical protein
LRLAVNERPGDPFTIDKGSGGESGTVFRPISEITATMEKPFYPFVIAVTFKIAAMKFNEAHSSQNTPNYTPKK